MKNVIVYQILKSIQQKPALAQKFKIFAALAFVGLFLTASLVIWAGISMVSYVASQTQQALKSPLAQAPLENLKNQVPPLPQVDMQGCWQSLQGLLAVQPWLEKPALQNINNLKVACLDPATPLCQGADCSTTKASSANWGS